MNRWLILLCLVALTFVPATPAAAEMHPGLGRFMQRDPARYRPGNNLSEAYTSNAVSLIDPLGLEPGDLDWERAHQVNSSPPWLCMETTWEPGGKILVEPVATIGGAILPECRAMATQFQSVLEGIFEGTSPGLRATGIIPSCSDLPCGCSVPPPGATLTTTNGSTLIQADTITPIAAQTYEIFKDDCGLVVSIPNGRSRHAIIECDGQVHVPHMGAGNLGASIQGFTQ